MPWTPDKLRDAHDILFGERERSPVELRSILRTGESLWRIQFRGSDSAVRHCVGLERYARLLASPLQPINALELVQPGLGGAGASPWAESGLTTTSALAQQGLAEATGGALREVDSKQKAELKKIWEKIQELQEARQRWLALDDEEAAAHAEGEIERLQQIRGLYGRGGRERDDSAPAEKARKAVTDSFAGARRRIKEEVPGLAEYLEKAIKTAGAAFVFSPLPGDSEWQVKLDF